MSMFFCAHCDNLRDADDGCDEVPGTWDLLCAECVDALECEAITPTDTPADSDGAGHCTASTTDAGQASGMNPTKPSGTIKKSDQGVRG
jgi:hypothetical protein